MAARELSVAATAAISSALCTLVAGEQTVDLEFILTTVGQFPPRGRQERMWCVLGPRRLCQDRRRCSKLVMKTCEMGLI